MQRVLTALLLVLLIGTCDVLHTRAQIEPEKIHRLEGVVDSSGTTHLYYRLYEEGTTVQDGQVEHRDHLHHFNPKTGMDTVVLKDYLKINESLPNDSQDILDFAVLFQDPAYYTATYISHYAESASSIVIYAPDTVIGRGYAPAAWSSADLITDPSNRRILYHATNGDTTRQVTDQAGRPIPFSNRADSVYLSYHLLSISPHNPDLHFGGDERQLLRIDQGNRSVILNSTAAAADRTHFYYTSDADVMFLKTTFADRGDVEMTNVYRSKNAGTAGSWTLLHQDSAQIAFAVDTSEGRVYRSRADTLLVSTDHGDSYQVSATFSNRITGIYTPQGKQALYVSTISDIHRRREAGNFSSIKHVNVAIEPNDRSGIPSSIFLSQNYPNPFNPTTKIRYSLPRAADVRLVVYDMLGRQVKTIVHGKKQAGHHTATFNGGNISSGVYIYRLKADGVSKSRKMLLVK